MKIKINEKELEVKEVITTLVTVHVILDGNIDEVKDKLCDAQDMEVFEDDMLIGQYSNIKLESVTDTLDGKVQASFHVMSDIEIKLNELTESQAAQDDAIAELYGKGE